MPFPTHLGKEIRSIEEFLKTIREDTSDFDYTWFRGEPETETPLLPRLYRVKPGFSKHHENKLLQNFRMRAPTFDSGMIPQRDEIDKWLFLAQHHGLPTRLLDWSENALVGLHFALLSNKPVLWVLDPIDLNREAEIQSPSPRTEKIEGTVEGDDQFPITWCHHHEIMLDTGQGREMIILDNIGFVNIEAAWNHDRGGVEKPVAIRPTNTHPRMSAQRSTFTVHGKIKKPLLDIYSDRLLKYSIPEDCIDSIKKDLRILGVDHSTVFPDLGGLAQELSDLY